MHKTGWENNRPGLAGRLEKLYEEFNRPEYVHPDPVEFLDRYRDVHDREIAALVASSLAYGRVASIIKSVAGVLDRMCDSPADFVAGASRTTLQRAFRGFKHRFTTGEDIAAMLSRVKRALARHGSLNALFLSRLNRSGGIVEAQKRFVSALNPLDDSCGRFSLLSCPSKGSACKRLNLYLRWMVRKDAVDPGGWSGIDPESLIVPLDTHMHRIGLHLGFTRRKQADLKAAIEITDGFRRFSPDDPVKYDFALTRPGIRLGAAPGDFILEAERERQLLKAAS